MKNIIFDLGAVVIDWNPKKIVDGFTNDENERKILLEYVNHQERWVKWDNGSLTEQEFSEKTSEITGFPLERIKLFFLSLKESLDLIPETIELLDLSKKLNKNIYCLSNMPVEVYDYLMNRYSLFEKFNGVVISGREKIAKPDTQIFKIVLQKYSLLPEETLFIDDIIHNITAAKQLGINTIQFFRNEECIKKIKNIISGNGYIKS